MLIVCADVTVHPHACGEHLCGCGLAPVTAGSPPRMWGTPIHHHVSLPSHRFTPTHVGNTRPQSGATARPSVHPHACGEHQPCPGHLDPKRGSPPRMWGTPRRRAIGALGVPVHPHACGEHSASLFPGPDPKGSPPRMWGTRSRRLSPSRQTRFTPTHVGNTSTDTPPSASSAVHPHACGEHEFKRLGRSVAFGSPPRMWGTLLTSVARA